MNILDTIKEFLSIQDWRLIIAGFGMLAIFVLMIYLISLIVLSFQQRRDAVNVRLPDINKGANGEKHHEKFKEAENLEVELVTESDDLIENPQENVNDELFIKTLSMETRRFIPMSEAKLNMPTIGKIDYKKLREEREKELKEKQKKDLEKLKQIAKMDEQNLVDSSLINNGGAVDD